MPTEQEFAEVKAYHENLIGNDSIEAGAILESLKRVLHVGETAAQNNEIGTVRFANETTALFTGALALNEAGRVVPPFTAKNIAKIHEQLDRLSVFTQGNAETGPTDTTSKPTSNKK